MNINDPLSDDRFSEPLEEDEKEKLYQSLQAKYAAAGNDHDVQDARDAQSTSNMAATIGQAVAGLGSARAASRGMNVPVQTGIFDAVRKNAAGDVETAQANRKEKMDNVLTSDKLGREDMRRDPASQESRHAQALAKKLMPDGDFSNTSAADLEKSLPIMKHMYEMDEKGRLAQQTAAERRQDKKDADARYAQTRADQRQWQQDQKTADHEWKEEQVTKANEEKKKAVLAEIEDRRTNINSALDTLDTMIAENGTWEATGSHNQDLERLVEQVATDMAKLQDPNSVARPSEVEAVKKNLVSSGFSNKNSTARDVLKNFRGEVERRADGAYKIRGLADINPNRANNVAGTPSGGLPGEDSATAAPGGKSVVGKQFSKSRNQTKVIYSDGTEEIVDGQK